MSQSKQINYGYLNNLKESGIKTIKEGRNFALAMLIFCWVCLGITLYFIPTTSENTQYTEEEKVEVKAEKFGKLVDLDR